ncbi:hypothetical protein SAMN05519103_03048 [Rhizobiales bacterium GAS113]|nr:hypothetical protein SAMN05519103_03048 [Rhizobiales bacterium GAS113]
MAQELLLGRDWQSFASRLGGDEMPVISTRGTKAFKRARMIEKRVDLLRMIRIGDRGDWPSKCIAAVAEVGANVLASAGWKNASSSPTVYEPFDLHGEFCKAPPRGLIDRRIKAGRICGPAIGRRVVAKTPGQAALVARCDICRAARKERWQISIGTVAAEIFAILVTPLAPEAFSNADMLALHLLRRRIELGFKCLKNLIGLKGRPGIDERSAKPHVLAHLPNTFYSSRSAVSSRTLPTEPPSHAPPRRPALHAPAHCHTSPSYHLAPTIACLNGPSSKQFK